MKVGFIGYGSMGSIMVEAFLRHDALAPEEIIVSNRTAGKLDELGERHPAVGRSADNALVAGQSDLLFLCVRSDQVGAVLEEIGPYLHPASHVVLINGGVGMGRAGPWMRVSKVIPTMTMEVGRGVALISHRSGVEAERREALERLFSAVGTVKVVREDELETATALTSCGPAFAATLVDELAEAAVRRGCPREEARGMITETFLATALLMAGGHRSPQAVCDSVATKGGITEEGLKVLRRDLPAMFDEVLSAILSKHRMAERR